MGSERKESEATIVVDLVDTSVVVAQRVMLATVDVIGLEAEQQTIDQWVTGDPHLALEQLTIARDDLARAVAQLARWCAANPEEGGGDDD